MAFGVTKVIVTAFLASKLGLLLESELLPLVQEDELLLLLEPLEAGAPLGAGFFFLAPAEELLDATDSTRESADDTESSASLPRMRPIS